MIVFSKHALRKMKQRRLKEEWIKSTVKKPDFLFKSSKRRFVAYKRIKTLYL